MPTQEVITVVHTTSYDFTLQDRVDDMVSSLLAEGYRVVSVTPPSVVAYPVKAEEGHPSTVVYTTLIFVLERE